MYAAMDTALPGNSAWSETLTSPRKLDPIGEEGDRLR
jgi:hypothetical protein